MQSINNMAMEKEWEKAIKMEIPVLYDLPVDPVIFINSIKSPIVQKEFIKFNERTREILTKNYEVPELITKLYFEETNFLSFSNDENGNIFLHYDLSSFLYGVLIYYLPSNNDIENENLAFINTLYEKIATGQLSKNELLNYTKQQLKGFRTKIKNIGAISYQSFLIEGYDNISAHLFDDAAGEIHRSSISQTLNHEYVSNLEKINITKKFILDKLTKIIMNINYIEKDICNKKIIFNPNDIDLDFLRFDIHRTLLEDFIKKGKKENNNAIYAVINYYQSITKNGNIPEYKLETISDDGKENEVYTFLSFAHSLQNYLLEHKEINIERIENGFFNGWNANEVDEYLNEFTSETLKNFEVINPNTIFFPPSKEEMSTKIDITKSTELREVKESLLVLRKRQFYADNNQKIYKCLMGKNQFKGHIAIVLNNGYVIFEKYDTKENDISSKNGAAYIMTINNFNKFSKKSLTEIREYIKSQNNDEVNIDEIAFKCHRGNWEEYIQTYIDLETGVKLSEIEQAVNAASDSIKKY